LVQDTIENNTKKALKIFNSQLFPKKLQRIQKEVDALKSIKSDRVISLSSTNIDESEMKSGESPYIVMEYAKFGDLTEHNYFQGEIDLSLRILLKIL